MEPTLYLADAEAALAEVNGPGGDTATLTTHGGTLHVFLPSVAAYGIFTAALTVKILERAFVSASHGGGAAAVARAARNTWDAHLADEGWVDGGVLGVWYPGVTIIEGPPAGRGPCICKGRAGHVNPRCPWYGSDTPRETNA